MPAQLRKIERRGEGGGFSHHRPQVGVCFGGFSKIRSSIRHYLFDLPPMMGLRVLSSCIWMLFSGIGVDGQPLS
jgi:hypothetical protein